MTFHVALYRRPEYVDNSHRASAATTLGSGSGDEKRYSTATLYGKSAMPQGIPESLAFDKIIKGGTCPPCTVRDFMNYLIYIEHAAENLQFFLWYRDYQKRWDDAKTSDMALAPEWSLDMENDMLHRLMKEKTQTMRKQPGLEIFKGTDFEKRLATPAIFDDLCSNPFSTPPHSPDEPSNHTGSHGASNDSYRSLASDAFTLVGAKQPFTIQPFREEIDRVVATYIMEGAPRQLNLSAKEREATLHALSHTTHPTAVRLAIRVVENSLRQQAHPNFIRWSICNGNPPRVLFARVLGTSLVFASFVIAILLTLSRIPRGWRALAAIGWILGISTLVAAYKGMCIVLHGMHHRHVRPWELFLYDDADEGGRGGSVSSVSKKSLEFFGPQNSYESEPWKIKYDKRNFVSKIFDREVWIEEPGLRGIQDIIFWQSMLCAVVLTGALTTVFMLVPSRGYF